MTKTSLLRKTDEMERRPAPKCHGGVGALDLTTVLAGADIAGARLAFIHDDVLAPGVSIGVHRHEDDEEYYYILSGKGSMTLDGELFDVAAGDITAVFSGGSHGLENSSDEALRVIVIGISGK